MVMPNSLLCMCIMMSILVPCWRQLLYKLLRFRFLHDDLLKTHRSCWGGCLNFVRRSWPASPSRDLVGLVAWLGGPGLTWRNMTWLAKDEYEHNDEWRP